MFSIITFIMKNADFINHRYEDIEDLGLAFDRARIKGFASPAFKRNLLKTFHIMDEAKADIDGYLDDYFLLEEQVKKDMVPHDADTTYFFATVHDDILKSVDKILLFYAFLLKNHGVLRQSIRAIKDDVNKELNMLAMPFAHINYIAQEWRVLVKDMYDMLDDIRGYFLPETKVERRESCNDDFSLIFLNGAEMPRERIFDRIEFLFFEKHGIPLGVFKTSGDVTDYIQRQTGMELFTINLVNDLKHDDLADFFPGLMIVDPATYDKRIQRKTAIAANAQNINGMITHPRPIFKPFRGFF